MNPKHIRAQKDGKTPLEFLIYSVLAEDALVHKSGADKYGVRNWRVDKILASTYEGAILRHFTAWASGEDIDPESGVHHLVHVRACCAIVRDAAMHGTLIDDRNRQESRRPEPEAGEPFPAHQGYPAPRCAKCKDQPCTCYEPVPPGEPEAAEKLREKSAIAADKWIAELKEERDRLRSENEVLWERLKTAREAADEIAWEVRGIPYVAGFNKLLDATELVLPETAARHTQEAYRDKRIAELLRTAIAKAAGAETDTTQFDAKNKRIAELEQELALLRDHIAELERLFYKEAADELVQARKALAAHQAAPDVGS